jgi:hypothetical protein
VRIGDDRLRQETVPQAGEPQTPLQGQLLRPGKDLEAVRLGKGSDHHDTKNSQGARDDYSAGKERKSIFPNSQTPFFYPVHLQSSLTFFIIGETQASHNSKCSQARIVMYLITTSGLKMKATKSET